MPPALGLGLLAAFMWGFVDLSAAIAGRRIGSLRAVVWTQFASLAGLGLFIHWGLASVGATGDLSWGMLANKPAPSIQTAPAAEKTAAT